MTPRALLLFCTLLSLASSSCLNSYEKDGECTKCDSLSFLDGKRCYLKIRGCLQNIAGPLCIQCQDGYILNKGACIRQAVFLGLSDLAPPPVAIQKNPSLSYFEIRDRLGEKYGSEFPKVHKYLLQKHAELKSPVIIGVSILQTKKEAILVVKYQIQSGEIYRSVTINTLSSINELSFSKELSTNNDPIIVQKQIIISRPALTNYTLYHFSNDTHSFIYDYLSPALDEDVIVTFNTTDKLGDKLTFKTLSFFDFVQEEVTRLYPSLANKLRTGGKKVGESLYLLQFEAGISVSAEFKDFSFKINAPVYKQLQTETNAQAANNYSSFDKTSDPSFVQIEKYVLQEFPQLKAERQVKVEKQKNEGNNFKLTYQGNGPTTTVVVVRRSQNGEISLVGVLRNGVRVFFPQFDYNSDPIFLASYQTIEKQSAIANIPTIRQVTKKIHGDIIEYIVTYSPTENAVIAFDRLKYTPKLVSYNVQGENVLFALNNDLATQAKLRSSQVLFQFLNNVKPETVGGRVQHASNRNSTSYELLVVTYKGSYLSQIEDVKGSLVLSSFEKLSQSTCYELSKDFIQKNEKIQYINSFLLKNYPLDGFQIQLIQVNVNENSVQYRFLFTSQKLKQIQIDLIEEGTTAKVTKAVVLNFGYESLNPDPQDPLYAQVLKLLANPTLKGDHIPFYTEANDTNVRVYYNDGNSTTEIVVDKKSGDAIGYVIGVNQYKLVPEGVNLAYLVNLKTADSVELKRIQQIISKASSRFSKYLVNPILRFVEKRASKTEDKYCIYYNTSQGYAKLTATYLKQSTQDIANKSLVKPVAEGDRIILQQLTITDDKDSDFYPCSEWNVEGKCLSCKQSEVEYEGACYPKMEGCLIQAGELCVRCNSNHIRSNYKCFRQCSMFFN